MDSPSFCDDDDYFFREVEGSSDAAALEQVGSASRKPSPAQHRRQMRISETCASADCRVGALRETISSEAPWTG